MYCQNNINALTQEAKKSAIAKIKQELMEKGEIIKLKKLNRLIKNEEV